MVSAGPRKKLPRERFGCSAIWKVEIDVGSNNDGGGSERDKHTQEKAVKY